MKRDSRALLLQLLDPSFQRCDLGDGVERDYKNAKAVAKAMAERGPEVRMH